MDRPPAPPEAALLRLAREAANIKVSEAARAAGISTARWSQIENGYETRHGGFKEVRAKAGMLARMAKVPGLTPERLAEEGQRPDAAEVLREIQRREEAVGAERVGLHLMARRAALDTRYEASRDVFATERGIDRDLARDVELGRRIGLSPDEKGTIERAYQLAAGSLDRALPGTQLEPAAGTPEADTDEGDAPADDTAGEMISAVISIAASRAEREIEVELARHPEGAPAGQIFADPVEQAIWAQQTKTRAERVRMLAAFRTAIRASVTRRVG
jgi:transcriptional regulator with XRE-family HTH domain